MKVLTYSHNDLTVSNVGKQLLQSDRVAQRRHFTQKDDLLQWLENNDADMVFVKLDEDGIDAINLVAKIKSKWHGIGIVCAALTNDFMEAAFRVHADGYILLPAQEGRVEEELRYIWERKTFWKQRYRPVTI